MKRILELMILLAVMCMASCSNNDAYDEMPNPIAKFVSQYYPNTPIESFTITSDGYAVVIKNGPTLDFDRSYTWTEVDGNGSVLPQVFLFDQLPPDLYQYLQESDNIDNVFLAARTTSAYTIHLLSSTLTYDTDTGQITGSGATL